MLGDDTLGELVDLLFLVALDDKERKSDHLVILGDTEVSKLQEALKSDLCKRSRDGDAWTRIVVLGILALGRTACLLCELEIGRVVNKAEIEIEHIGLLALDHELVSYERSDNDY